MNVIHLDALKSSSPFSLESLLVFIGTHSTSHQREKKACRAFWEMINDLHLVTANHVRLWLQDVIQLTYSRRFPSGQAAALLSAQLQVVLALTLKIQCWHVVMETDATSSPLKPTLAEDTFSCANKKAAGRKAKDCWVIFGCVLGNGMGWGAFSEVEETVSPKLKGTFNQSNASERSFSSSFWCRCLSHALLCMSLLRPEQQSAGMCSG